MKIFKRLIPVALSFLLCVQAFAIGEGNMDGGGGDMGQGNKGNRWLLGDDGVRITVVDAKTEKPKTTPVDFTNKSPNVNTNHFGKKSKINYRNGSKLNWINGNYTYKNPTHSLPRIISENGRGNIEAIKRYFADEQILRDYCKIVGTIKYDDLISGKYKLLIEPIAYFKFGGVDYAATAHEAALFDQVTKGKLSNAIGQLTRKNLPLALFLQTADLGFSAWNGTKNGIVSNSDIINYLGLGIVKFKDDPNAPNVPSVETPDFEYHTDIDVYTSFKISSSSDITSPKPKSKEAPSPSGKPPTVTIQIGSIKTETINYYVPAGEETTVFVKWHTPKEPQDIPIKVTVTGGGSLNTKSECTARIIDIVENEPPDTKAEDKPPTKRWKAPPLPAKSEVTDLSWVVYDCKGWKWIENWVDRGHRETDSWTDSDGKTHTSSHWVSNWVDEGWYEHKGFDELKYNVKLLNAKATLKPDKYCRTAKQKGKDLWEIKSGYGLQLEVSANVGGGSSTHNIKIGERTDIQNCVAVFPEFNYQTYNRFLIPKSNQKNCFEFKENQYAYNPAPIHFTPIWFPDNSKYWVRAYVFDVWTPGGMLYTSADAFVDINGDCYDDWTVTQVNNNQSIMK